MKTESKIVIAAISIVVLIFIIVYVYPFTQVSTPQFSSFDGNIEDFHLKGKNCIVEFNAKDICYISKEFTVQHIRNITIENNGEKNLIDYSPILYVNTDEDFYLPLSNVENVDVDIFFKNLTVSKHINYIELEGDMEGTYLNNLKPKSGELIINKAWGVNLSIGGKEVRDFKRLSCELDDSSNIYFISKNISLLANEVSDLKILKSQKSQISELALIQGEGTLLLDDHLFEIKGSNILNIVISPSQLNYFTIDNTKARFYGLSNFARLNTEDIIISDFEYWITKQPEKLNAYAVVILAILTGGYVILTGWYAHEARSQTRLMIKDRERPKVLEEVQDVLTPAITHIKSEIDAIQNKKVLWHRYTSGGCGFSSGLRRLFYSMQYGSVQSLFDETSSGALKDILNKFSNLDSMFSSHDFLIDELNQFYEEIEKEIKTPELKKRLEEMTKEFNKGKSATYRLKGEPIENAFRFYGEYLINLEYTIERIPDSIEPIIDFWEENQDELLKFRDKLHIIEINKQLSKKLIQLKELDEEILKKLEKIREGYRKEYNFINNEIEPFRGF